MHKLLDMYRDYCDKCSKGTATINTHYEQIPAKLIVLCFDKDCGSFRFVRLFLFSFVYLIMHMVLSSDFFIPTGHRIWGLYLLKKSFHRRFLQKKEQGIGLNFFLISNCRMLRLCAPSFLRKEGKHLHI